LAAEAFFTLTQFIKPIYLSSVLKFFEGAFSMNIIFAILLTVFLTSPLAMAADKAADSGGFENRCGYVDNPTPAN